MIHRTKAPNGSFSFRAYSMPYSGKDCGESVFVGAFDSSEAAKDALIEKLIAQVESMRLRAIALYRAITSGCEDDADEGPTACAEIAGALKEDMYFVSSNAENLFRAPGHHGGGTTPLHAEAAIEYARRHDMLVQYAELEGGNFKDGFPQAVTPGHARELLPHTRQRWIWVDVPDDMVTDDLPKVPSPTSLGLPREPRVLDADGMREELESTQREIEFSHRWIRRQQEQIAKLEAALAAGVEELVL